MWSDAADRYKTSIANIFQAENKLRLQLLVETTLSKVQADLGIITPEDAKEIEQGATNVKLDRVKEIEIEIHHDLMAVVKALAEQSGEAGEKVHFGATSTDVQDTVLALQMKESKRLIINKVTLLENELARIASENKDIACIGRTHGQFAVPTTLGFKFANFLYELFLAKTRLNNSNVSISKFSGAVGNYGSLNESKTEENLLGTLDLEPVLISTQVVSRVIHADLLMALALIASVLERISKEIRNSQRSEIGELLEPFVTKQVGSSAMPHKRNPHKSERISGLARIVRGNVAIGLENISLEHERDITHSSVERIIIPESLNLLYFMLNSLTSILKNLEINYNAIERNLSKAMEESFSEKLLMELTPQMGRQKGHEILRGKLQSPNFLEAILNDPVITDIVPPETIKSYITDFNVEAASAKVMEVLKKLRY